MTCYKNVLITFYMILKENLKKTRKNLPRKT